MREQAHCRDEAANHQVPIAVAFWIIQIAYAEECSSLIQNLMQIHCSICSVILNARVTQYTCSLNGIYSPHWLIQCSCHCSHMHIPVQSPWLQGYIDVKIILVILTTIGLFPRQTSSYAVGFRDNETQVLHFESSHPPNLYLFILLVSISLHIENKCDNIFTDGDYIDEGYVSFHYTIFATSL